MSRKNVIALGIVVLVTLGMCVGIRLSMNGLPLAYGARTSELGEMIVDMGKNEFLEDSFIKYLRNDRKEENLKEIFENATELLVVKIKDDPLNYNEWNFSTAEICGVIWSQHGLQEGEEITLVTENDFQISDDMECDYSVGIFYYPLQQGKYYLMPLRNYTGSESAKKISKEKGLTLPVRYSSISAGWYSQLPLEEDLIIKKVEKGKHYQMKELMDYETFSFSQGVVEEWHKTRLKILDYYLGDQFLEERRGKRG